MLGSIKHASGGEHILKIFICLMLVAISGCAQLQPWQHDAAHRQALAEETLLAHSQKLANSLFANLQPLPYGKLAVVSFTELQSLTLSEANQPLNMLGLQLQESMITISAQRGFQVVEIRAGKEISLSANHEGYLSREQSAIADSQDIRYMIVGTLFEGTDNTTVNARILDVQQGVIVAAVSDQIPNAIIGLNTNQIQMKQQQLYRSALSQESSK